MVKDEQDKADSLKKPPVIFNVDALLEHIRKPSSNDIRIVDVRKEEDYANEHIPNAVSFPLAQLLKDDSPSTVTSILEDLGISDETFVVVYDDTFGALASRVAWTFEYVGHENISLLEVTFSQWKRLGLPTENKINSPSKTKHSLKIRKDIYADILHVDETKGKPNIVILDNRERLNYLTEHIPSSVNMPYTMLGAEDRILRSAEDIKRFLNNRGITNEQEIITYCGSVGTLSGLAFYALRLAGIENVKLYTKSFKEWKASGKPKEEIKDANYWDLSAE
jgi:thiosulfate/3-mercaptopyruvate sulfurtransferase